MIVGDSPETVTVKTHAWVRPPLSVAVYVMRVVPMGKSYGDTISGDLVTVGAAFGSCNSALSLTTGSLQVTLRVALSGSVPLFASGGQVMYGGCRSVIETMWNGS